MSPTEVQLAHNSVVLYEHEGEPALAVVVGYKNSRYIILNDKGRQLELSLSRLTAFKILCKHSLSQQEQQTFLLSLNQQIKKLSDSIELEDLWLVAVDSQALYASHQLAELYFGKPSPEQELAMHVRLLTNKIFFKRDKDKFAARSKEVVQELKKAELAQLQKNRLKDQFVEWVRSNDSCIPPELSGLLHKIKKYAVNSTLSVSEEREVRDVLELSLGASSKNLHKPTPQSAYALLENLNVFTARTNPAWIRSGLSDNFELKDHKLKQDSLQRQDFRQLDCFTIDDESTRDMDDALSLEILDNSYRLGIHISDVASYIDQNSEFDLILSKRQSSIYLPERTVNMLPADFSEQQFSLVQDCDRSVISLLLEISRDMQILNYKFVPAIIRVKRRWSYVQVDQMLEQANSEFNTFYEIASSFESQRLEQGALQVNKHQLNIKVDSDGKVILVEEEEHGPARSIIAEMAIVYNRLCAEYLSSAGLPAIFRGQEPAEQIEQEEIEESRARDYNLRVRLKPSNLSIRAQPHSSLGLKAYLQVTSPIRRYFDIINQKQLLAALNSQASYYDERSLLDLIEHSQEVLSLIAKVSKESRRFWLLRYLEQRIRAGQGNRLSAVVVKVGAKLPMVELDEVFFSSFIKSKRKLTVGEKVIVQIVAVDAREDYLRLELVE